MKLREYEERRAKQGLAEALLPPVADDPPPPPEYPDMVSRLRGLFSFVVGGMLAWLLIGMLIDGDSVGRALLKGATFGLLLSLIDQLRALRRARRRAPAGRAL